MLPFFFYNRYDLLYFTPSDMDLLDKYAYLPWAAVLNTADKA